MALFSFLQHLQSLFVQLHERSLPFIIRKIFLAEIKATAVTINITINVCIMSLYLNLTTTNCQFDI